MRLNVSVHNAFRVAIVQGLSDLNVRVSFIYGKGKSAYFEELEHVITNIVISESRVKHFEVDIVDVFCDQAWDLRGRIANHVQEGYNVGTTSQVLEDFYFSLDLLLLDGFEDFDDTLFIVDNVNTLENLSRRSEGG